MSFNQWKRPLVWSFTVLILSFACLLLYFYFRNNAFDYANFQKDTGAYPNLTSYQFMLFHYVNNEGEVDYAGLAKDTKMELVENEFNQYPPSIEWTKEQELSYWINAYNFFTLKLIADHYPVNSIIDLHPAIYIPMLNGVWNQRVFMVNGQAISLHDIEHNILRVRFKEPRIHFAINCASKSCPSLRNEIYEPLQLEEQLHAQAYRFVNDESKNSIEKDVIRLSPIFSWFQDDFISSGGVMAFLKKHSNKDILENVTVEYMEYDWTLNGF